MEKYHIYYRFYFSDRWLNNIIIKLLMMKKHISEVEDHLYLPTLTNFNSLICEFERLDKATTKAAYAIADLTLIMEKIKRKNNFKRRNSRRNFYLN